MSDTKTADPLPRLIERAKRHAEAGPATPSRALVAELVSALEAALAREEEIRKAAYLDGVRSAVKVVREKKEAIRSQSGEPTEAEAVGSVHDEVTGKILDITHEGDVTRKDLVELVTRIRFPKKDIAGVDRDVVRTYYALINKAQPSSDDVLPIGRPMESLDVALAMAGRLLPDGWWSLGANFDLTREPATALVGASPKDDPPPQRAGTPARALLAAAFQALSRGAKE